MPVSVKACSDRQRVLIFDLGLIMIGLLAIYCWCKFEKEHVLSDEE